MARTYQIEVHIGDSEEVAASYAWEFIPRVGDSISLDGEGYLIKEVWITPLSNYPVFSCFLAPSN
jgi:hypothetical protein